MNYPFVDSSVGAVTPRLKSEASSETLNPALAPKKVSEVTVAGDATGVTGGQLEVTASWTPAAAPDGGVEWSVDGDATVVSQSLSAITIELGAAGTVTVTATSRDGSNVSDSLEITVSAE